MIQNPKQKGFPSAWDFPAMKLTLYVYMLYIPHQASFYQSQFLDTMVLQQNLKICNCTNETCATPKKQKSEQQNCPQLPRWQRHFGRLEQTETSLCSSLSAYGQSRSTQKKTNVILSALRGVKLQEVTQEHRMDP